MRSPFQGLAFGFWVAGACGAQVPGAVSLPPDAAPVALEHVLSDQYSGIAEARRAVLRNEAAWVAFWAEATRPRGALAPQRVDFTRDMVIIAAMGTRGTGGHGIAIEGAYRGHGGLVVVVKEVSPAPRCVVSQALTAPLDVVRVPRTDDPVTFVERREEVPC